MASDARTGIALPNANLFSDMLELLEYTSAGSRMRYGSQHVHRDTRQARLFLPGDDATNGLTRRRTYHLLVQNNSDRG